MLQQQERQLCSQKTDSSDWLHTLAPHSVPTCFLWKLLVMKFYHLFKKKKSAKIFLTYLTRMLERLKLDSCESVSNSPRRDWRNALWINLFIVIMIPSHSLLPLKALDSADQAVSYLASKCLLKIIPPEAQKFLICD